MFANGLGWPHLLILAVVFLVLFGSKRLPDAARSIGRSLKVFKDETANLRDDNSAAQHQENPVAPAAQPVAQFTAQPAAQPVAQFTAQPAAQPVAQFTAQPAAQPAAGLQPPAATTP